jgi:hypothetical protein
MIKIVMVLLAVVTVFGFVAGVEKGNISLDFENSGSIEWLGEPDVILDFENSGSIEWLGEPDVILDFENSGSIEWLGEPDVILDFENSGSIEWLGEPDVILSADFANFNIKSIIKNNSNKFNGFKNSGLPETIEIESMSL